MKVYVCGGSTEMADVAKRMGQLRALGHTITMDWVATIRANGEANPRNVPHSVRARWAEEDIDGIVRADIVWAMLPARTSFGCAFEVGYACGHGHAVIVSGDWRASIFSSQALARFNEHDHALEWLKLYSSPGDHHDDMVALEAF
jgi:hypothetical protein